jgi:hypothetical protein
MYPKTLVMKIIISLIVAAILTTGLFLASKNFGNPILWMMIGIGIWTLFIWNYSRISKKAAKRKYMERLFSMHWRNRRNFS